MKRDRRFPVKVQRGDGSVTGVIPDGWIDIRIDQHRYCFCLEVERGSHMPVQIREKIRNLCFFAQGPYEKTFATNILTYIFFAKDEDYAKDILKHAAIQLEEMQLEEYAVLFKVTSADLADSSFFREPVWYTPDIPIPSPGRLFT
ncbi:MAG: hypothetical protein IPO81_22975 [Kouleothrix sp.]|nr:hypothetical protein [Kouleothrix sp.]